MLLNIGFPHINAADGSSKLKFGIKSETIMRINTEMQTFWIVKKYTLRFIPISFINNIVYNLTINYSMFAAP